MDSANFSEILEQLAQSVSKVHQSTVLKPLVGQAGLIEDEHSEWVHLFDQRCVVASTALFDVVTRTKNYWLKNNKDQEYSEAGDVQAIAQELQRRHTVTISIEGLLLASFVTASIAGFVVQALQRKQLF